MVAMFCIRNFVSMTVDRLCQHLSVPAIYFLSCDLDLSQLVTTQKEMQKQITIMVAVPVAKEGKRMEGLHALPLCDFLHCMNTILVC